MNRPMTAAEKTRFQGYFPGLNVNSAVVTDNVTSVYNCISWTVGVTNRWLWPGSSIGAFDTFYRGFGFARAGNGPIAAWGHSTSTMTHGSISGPSHGPRWESKCGQDLRIQHGLNELVGSTYGRVVAFYSQSRSLTVLHDPNAKSMKNAKIPQSYLSSAQQKELRLLRGELPADLRDAYSERFRAWKDSWFRGGLAINSDPHSRTIGQEFDALIALGPGILPLVVESLADPENFLALQLYDALQPDEKLIVQFAPDDERIMEGEQGRAHQVVQNWFANR